MRDVIYSVRGPKLMSEMTPDEFEQRVSKTKLAIMAAGAIEHHGRHNPLGADKIEAEGFVRETVARLENDGIIVLGVDPIPYGPTMDRAYGKYTGTLSFSHETFIAVFKDICRGLYRWSVRKIIIVEHHDGNYEPLMVAAREIAHELPELRVASLGRVPVQWRQGAGKKFPGEIDGHGGRRETSLVLACQPELVDLSKAKPYFPPSLPSNPHYGPPKEEIPFDGQPLSGGAYFRPIRDWRVVSEEGYVGDPTKATAETGNIMMNQLVEWVCKIVKRDFLD